MRVALPVDPYFKTESEVATIEYIRRHTSIPVPQVVAYSSSPCNELGFEWILMEKISGVPLEKVWDEMNFDAKMDFTVAFAPHMKQLQQLRFPMFGSIYFADIWDKVDSKHFCPRCGYPSSSAAINDSYAAMSKEFVIGRMVSTRFFRDKRLLVSDSLRGPFETTHQLLIAETEVLGHRIRKLSPNPGADYYCEVDIRLAEDGAEVLDVFDTFHQIVSTAISPVDGPEDVKMLWHNDISLRNILVDPQTYQLMGIVDWESVSVIPAWDTSSWVPYFLRGIEVLEPPPRASLLEEDDKDMEAGAVRRDWELVLLRRKYAELVDPVYDVASALAEAVDLKMKVAASLNEFEEIWKRTRDWTTNYRESIEGSTDLQQG